MAKNTRKSKRSGAVKREKTEPPRKTKRRTCIDMLKRPRGASLAELQKATGWQAHSVRGFLSGTVKKLEGVRLITDIDDGGARRYRIKPGKGS